MAQNVPRDSTVGASALCPHRHDSNMEIPGQYSLHVTGCIVLCGPAPYTDNSAMMSVAASVSCSGGEHPSYIALNSIRNGHIHSAFLKSKSLTAFVLNLFIPCKDRGQLLSSQRICFINTSILISKSPQDSVAIVSNIREVARIASISSS